MTDAELRRLAEAVAEKGQPDFLHVDDNAWGPLLDLLAANPAAILALLDRIDAVRALHLEAQMGFVVNLCRECHHTWPCPTIRALDGAE